MLQQVCREYVLVTMSYDKQVRTCFSCHRG